MHQKIKIKLEKIKLNELREKIQAKLKAKITKKLTTTNYTPPKYDDVYFKGVEWLDSLAGYPY